MRYEKHTYLANSRNNKRVNIDLFVKDGLVNDDMSLGDLIDKTLRQEVQYAFAKSMGYAQNRYDKDLIDFIYDIQQMSEVETRPFGIVNNWLKGESIGNDVYKRNDMNVDLGPKSKEKLWCLVLDLDGIINIKDLLDLEPRLRNIFCEYNLFYRKSRSSSGLHVFIPLIQKSKDAYYCRVTLNNIFRYIKSLVMPLNDYFNRAIIGTLKASFFENDEIKSNAFRNLINTAEKNGKLQKLSIDTKVLSLGRILFNSPHPVSFIVNRADYPTISEFLKDLRVSLGIFRNAREAKECENDVFIEDFENDAMDCAEGMGIKVERMRSGKRKKEGKPILSNVRQIQGLAQFINMKQQEKEEIKKNDKDDETIKIVKEYNVNKEIKTAKENYDNAIKNKPIFNDDGEIIGYYEHTQKIEDNFVVKLHKKIEKFNSLNEKQKDKYKKDKVKALKSVMKGKSTLVLRKNWGRGYYGLLSIFADLAIPFTLFGNYFHISVSPNENSAMDLYHYFANKDAWYLQSENAYRHFDEINKLFLGKNELSEEDYEGRYTGIILNVKGMGRQKNPIIKMKYFPMMLWQIFKNWGYDFTIEECIWLTLSLGYGVQMLTDWRFAILQGFVDALERAIESGEKQIFVGRHIKDVIAGKERNHYMASFLEFIETVSGGLFVAEKKFGNAATMKITDSGVWEQITNLDGVKEDIDEMVEQEFAELKKNKQGISCNESLAMKAHAKIDMAKDKIQKELTNTGIIDNKEIDEDVLIEIRKYCVKQQEYFQYVENNLHKLDKRFLFTLIGLGQLMGLKTRFQGDYIAELHKLGSQNPIYFWIEQLNSTTFWKVRKEFFEFSNSLEFRDNFILKQNQEQKRVFYKESKKARETFKQMAEAV